MRSRIGFAACALLLAATLPAAGSTFLAMSPEELVAKSSAVVVGTVLEVDSFRSDSGRLVLSQAAVRVDEVVTGEAPSVVLIQTAGGTVDGYTVVAHGFPRFETGQRVLVFLSEESDGTARVVGYRLGQYKVLRDGAGADVAVPTLEREVQLLTSDGRLAPRPRARQLETFKQEIRALANGRRPLVEQ